MLFEGLLWLIPKLGSGENYRNLEITILLKGLLLLDPTLGCTATQFPESPLSKDTTF